MSERKWTPGEWQVVRDANAFWSGTIAVLEQSPEKTLAVVGSYARERQHDEANAHLIAASPALYDALDLMVTSFEERGYGDFPSVEAARDALRKARGEQ